MATTSSLLLRGRRDHRLIAAPSYWARCPFGPAFAVMDHWVGPSAHAMISNRSRTILERLRHETRISCLYSCSCCRFYDPACDRANAQDGQGPWHVILRREPGVAGLFVARRQGQL